MRWKIEGYDVRFNPKDNNKSWNAEQGVTMNLNGNTSNPNLLYLGTQSFTIDLYERPTYAERSPLYQGAYISITEERVTERHYLLKTDGTCDVRGYDGGYISNMTLTSGEIGLPTGKPSSLVHMDEEIGFLYKESGQSTVVVTDKYGVGNRKYTYDSFDEDMYLLEAIGWDYGTYLYLLNPYGKIYKINKGNGAQSFLYEFEDFEANKLGNIKRYTDVFGIDKNGNHFIAVLQDKKELVILNNRMEIATKVETTIGNALAVSHSNYSGNFFMLLANKTIQFYPNTCRLDIDIIKDFIASGRVTIRDEAGLPSLLAVRSLRVARNRNMHEAKYELSFSGDIIYDRQTFGGKWLAPNRSLL